MFSSYPTRYGGLSDHELYSLYREAAFRGLNDAEKLDLLQETVNRDCVSKGMVGSPIVQWAQLPVNTAAEAAPNGIISVNQQRVCSGTVTLQDASGNTISRDIPAFNIDTLNSVLHENVHELQFQMLNGSVAAANLDEFKALAANDFTFSLVLNSDGTLRDGSQYLCSGNFYTYYFQFSEAQAFEMAEKETLSIVQELIDSFGQEPSFQTYFQSVLASGYAAQEATAAALYNNQNFAAEVNQVLMNQYYGTQVPVDPAIEAVVKNDMIASYAALHGKPSLDPTLQNTALEEKTNNAMEENTMNPDNNHLPVSLEEYNADLTAGVPSETAGLHDDAISAVQPDDAGLNTSPDDGGLNTGDDGLNNGPDDGLDP